MLETAGFKYVIGLQFFLDSSWSRTYHKNVLCGNLAT